MRVPHRPIWLPIREQELGGDFDPVDVDRHALLDAQDALARTSPAAWSDARLAAQAVARLKRAVENLRTLVAAIESAAHGHTHDSVRRYHLEGVASGVDRELEAMATTIDAPVAAHTANDARPLVRALQHSGERIARYVADVVDDL